MYSKKSLGQWNDHYPELDRFRRSVNIIQLTHSNTTLRQRREKDKSLSHQHKLPKMLNKAANYFKGFLGNPLRLLSPNLIK